MWKVLKTNEEGTGIETFNLGSYRMYVSDEHRFGTDAFLLAYFSQVRKTSIVCDLCTGCGIIPMILTKNNSPKLVYAVDIQKEAIELLEKTVEENRLENVVAPICADLRNIEEIAPESIDIVTANPPYMTGGSGFEKYSYAKTVARHEILCNIDDVCRVTSKILIYGGYLKMCNRPERLTDVLCSMRANNIEPKVLTLVFNNPNEKPWLFLVSGKKGAKPGLQISKPMILQKDDEQYTEEFTKIYE